MIPRIQGRVGQVEDPPDLKGKWAFEITVTILGTDASDTFGPIGYWDTEATALQNLQDCVKMLVEKFEKDTTGNISGEYFDMKTNSRRRWDKSDEN